METTVAPDKEQGAACQRVKERIAARHRESLDRQLTEDEQSQLDVLRNAMLRASDAFRLLRRGPSTAEDVKKLRAWRDDPASAPGSLAYHLRSDADAQRYLQHHLRVASVASIDRLSATPALVRSGSGQRPRERRDGSRRHSTRGSTDDSDGESERPAACERCGAQLQTAARYCGFCEAELGGHRACRICGDDISHRRADAETCSPAHKVALQRQRARLNPLEAAARRGISYQPVRCRCITPGAALESVDGDLFCSKCGRWTQPTHARVNGYNRVFAEMLQRDLWAPYRHATGGREWRVKAGVVV